MRKISLFLVFVLFGGFIYAQDNKNIVNLDFLVGRQIKTLYSDGYKDQAAEMAARCDRVMSFYKDVLNFEPYVTLLVLSKEDWGKYTNFPVYGMPHYTDAKTLIVAAEDNDFWRSFIPPMDALPTDLAQKIATTYSDGNGSVTMKKFFDLLAIHELAHAYEFQGKLNMQRKWMQELFANIFLHTYIAEKEPELLPALMVFPQMVVTSTNKSDLKYTTLDELDYNYDTMSMEYPNNYGWYQSRWHIMAGNIYDQGGVKALKKLWRELRNNSQQMDDAALDEMLSNNVHPSVADARLKWNK